MLIVVAEHEHHPAGGKTDDIGILGETSWLAPDIPDLPRSIERAHLLPARGRRRDSGSSDQRGRAQ